MKTPNTIRSENRLSGVIVEQFTTRSHLLLRLRLWWWNRKYGSKAGIRKFRVSQFCEERNRT